MAKNLKRRSDVERLLKKWEGVLCVTYPQRAEWLSFGRIFSRDPIDCGKPRCPLCSYDKTYNPKSRRLNLRKQERNELEEFLNEVNPPQQ